MNSSMYIFKKILPELVITVIFLISRSYNLLKIPIFTDEAIYTYWAQIALHDPNNRFISMEDGKQPLFIWLAAIFQSFIKDPLLASRLVSVFSGALTIIGIYLIAKNLFSIKIARIATILYILLPFSLIYDRLALYDSLLTSITTFALYFSIKLAQKSSLENALLGGITFGLGLITKSSALLFLYLIPLPFIFLKFSRRIKFETILRWSFFAALVFIIAQGFYNALRVSPLFYLISRKNYEFIRPITEFFSSPFAIFSSNLKTLISWQISYLGYPLFLIFLVAIIHAFTKKDKKILLLSIYILFPFFIKTFFNIVIYPRFMLFYFPLMLLIIASFFTEMLKKYKHKTKIIYVTAVLFLIYPLISSIFLLTNPVKAKIATSDKNQYISSWPAGYGVKEIVEIIKKDSKDSNVYIATEGTFGLLPFALKIYFYENPNIQIEGFWPVDINNLPSQVKVSDSDTRAYFVFNENQKEIINPHLKFISKYQKGDSNSYMRLYKII